jgi:hypothetical protein
MQTTELIEQVLALKLLNPVSKYDVDADDVYSYLEVCEGEPSVEGFKTWLFANA